MTQLFRRSGLRGRLLIALVLTSALTLVVAAAALLPPLQERLKTQRVEDLQAATEADVPQFEKALVTPCARRRATRTPRAGPTCSSVQAGRTSCASGRARASS